MGNTIATAMVKSLRIPYCVGGREGGRGGGREREERRGEERRGEGGREISLGRVGKIEVLW